MTLTLAKPAPISTAEPVPPPRKSSRLIAVDATRGIALLGMMAVHSMYESDAAGNPTLAFAIFGGRAAAAFAVLAGVGIAFTTGRRRVRLSAGPATAASLAARALAVAAIGFSLGFADASFGAVILPYYAVLFLLAIPLVFLPTWLVAVFGAVASAGMPMLSHLVLPHLPVASLDNPTLGDLIHQPLGLLTELSLTGEYPALPWLTYLCAGLVIGRLNLSKIKVALGLLISGLTVAIAVPITSSILLNRYGGLAQIWAAQPDSPLTGSETTELLTLGGDGTPPTPTWWWFATDSPHTSTPLDLLGTTGSAVAVLGGLLLTAHLTRPFLRRLFAIVLAPLAAAGSMTLTLYTAHIMFINSGYDVYSASTGYFVQVIAALLIGLAWRATAGRGPLEALVSMVAIRARHLVAWKGNQWRSTSTRGATPSSSVT